MAHKTRGPSCEGAILSKASHRRTSSDTYKRDCVVHKGMSATDKQHCWQAAPASRREKPCGQLNKGCAQLQPGHTLLRCVMEHLVTHSCQSDHKGGINSRLNGDKVLVGVGGHHVPGQTQQAGEKRAQVSTTVSHSSSLCTNTVPWLTQHTL